MSVQIAELAEFEMTYDPTDELKECNPVDELIDSAMAMDHAEMFDEDEAYDEMLDEDNISNQEQEQSKQFTFRIERKALKLRCSIELAEYIDELHYQVAVLSAQLADTSTQVTRLIEINQSQAEAQASSSRTEFSSQKFQAQGLSDNPHFDGIPF